MPRALAAARRRGPIFEAAVRRPSDQSGPTSTMCPRSRKLSIVALGTRFSITNTPGREVRGQNEIGKCSECQAGASIASCKFILAWVPQEELRDPLILLVAAGRTPGQIRLAVAQRHGRGK